MKKARPGNFIKSNSYLEAMWKKHPILYPLLDIAVALCGLAIAITALFLHFETWFTVLFFTGGILGLCFALAVLFEGLSKRKTQNRRKKR